MTWFHICTANHNESGRSSLTDQVEWATAGLLDAGHQVSQSVSCVEAGAINLFWECFPPQFPRHFLDLDIAYGIVATEIPDGIGFNWRTDVWWQERYESFFVAASKASFIWVLVESAVPFYAQFAPAAYLEMGFSERLIPDYIDTPPTVDFSFFGQHTPYRDQAVEHIRRYASVEWPDEFLPHDEVHKMIARSRIGLNFKQSEEWPVPSGPRLGRLMLAKRGVASEFLLEPTRQGEICGFCPQDADFVDYALSMLNSDWRGRAQDKFDRYRAEMPAGAIMEQVVASTVPPGLGTRSSAFHVLPIAAEWIVEDDVEPDDTSETIAPEAPSFFVVLRQKIGAARQYVKRAFG